MEIWKFVNLHSRGFADISPGGQKWARLFFNILHLYSSQTSDGDARESQNFSNLKFSSALTFTLLQTKRVSLLHSTTLRTSPPHSGYSNTIPAKPVHGIRVCVNTRPITIFLFDPFSQSFIERHYCIGKPAVTFRCYGY